MSAPRAIGFCKAGDKKVLSTTRMAFSVFLNNAYSTLRNWSKDTEKEKVFTSVYDIDDKAWLLAYKFLNDKITKMIKRVPSTDIYLLIKKH